VQLGWTSTGSSGRRSRLGALLAGAAVSVSGLIGFVGFMTPHLLRLVVGAATGACSPRCCSPGRCSLVLADLVSRAVLAPQELPLGAVTALIGGPFFSSAPRERRASVPRPEPILALEGSPRVRPAEPPSGTSRWWSGPARSSGSSARTGRQDDARRVASRALRPSAARARRGPGTPTRCAARRAAARRGRAAGRSRPRSSFTPSRWCSWAGHRTGPPRRRLPRTGPGARGDGRRLGPAPRRRPLESSRGRAPAVVLAQALAQGRRCCCSDEPTIHLDVRHVVDVSRSCAAWPSARARPSSRSSTT